MPEPGDSPIDDLDFDFEVTQKLNINREGVELIRKLDEKLFDNFLDPDKLLGAQINYNHLISLKVELETTHGNKDWKIHEISNILARLDKEHRKEYLNPNNTLTKAGEFFCQTVTQRIRANALKEEHDDTILEVIYRDKIKQIFDEELINVENPQEYLQKKEHAEKILRILNGANPDELFAPI